MVKRKRVIDDDDSETENGTEDSTNNKKKIKIEEQAATSSKMQDDDEAPVTPTKVASVKREDDNPDVPITPIISRKNRTPRRRTAVKEEDPEDAVKNKKQTKMEEDDIKSEEKPKPKRKRKTVKEDDDDDDFEYNSDDEKPKKKKTPAKKSRSVKKEEKEVEATPSKGKKGKKVKKEEPEEDENVFKWWREENVEELLNSDVKWKTFKHNGVLFPPEYEPHGIPVTYNGKDVKLTPEEEELATMYALMRETEYYSKPLFIKNFWKFWQPVLGSKHVIKDLSKCDFTKIWNWHLEEKEKKLGKSREEKKQEKEEKDKFEEKYKWCEINGRKEKVGNFRVEPPGLFRGRGEHPKQGYLKKRVRPEDITINIGKKSDAPKPPKGHKWKEVISNNKVTWLASWKDGITGSIKYVNLASSSSFKGVSDFLKYQTARDLKSKINKIRKVYKENWESSDEKTRQLGVAMYFIDKLALRVGNEKDDEEEADTVGCCSLRCEHLTLKAPKTIEFDFLGKDSIRYHNSVEVEEKVFKCIKQFMKDKEPENNVFHLINSTSLNKELKEFMPKLSAKVFRTFNASLTLDKCLKEMDTEIEEDMGPSDKIAVYNKANREVAILCNHQKTVSKTHDSSMGTIDKRIEMEEEYLSKLQDAKKKIKKKGYEEIKAAWDKEYEEKVEEFEKELKKFEKEQEDIEKEAKKKGVSVAVLTGSTKKAKAPKKPTKKALPKTEEALGKAIEKTKLKIKDIKNQKQMKEDNKTVALGTSRINYCDPRITVAWCKRNSVDVKKLFSRTLMEKFPWAMDAEPDYTF